VIASIFCGPGITCSPVFGYLTVVMAFVIFVGSIYLVLSAVFGRRMGYLVLAVAFFGWMIILSGLWVSGYFISQGLDTKKDLGPRGTEPHWVAIGAGVEVRSQTYPVISSYPDKPWVESTGPDDPRQASVGTVTPAIQDFMAARANEQLKASGSNETVEPEDFTVTDVKFASAGRTSLAAAHAVFNGGGPTLIVFARHDSGSVPIYSYIFLFASILGLGIHLPFLDRAERRRKAVLTGGRAPQFLGPA
jgi:hypothetical protein